MSTGMIAAGAGMAGEGHRDPDGFLGMNWPNVGVTVLLTMVTAVAADIAIAEWNAYRQRNR
jgi:hypothetical protein